MAKAAQGVALDMRYVSTRSQAPAQGFCDVLLAGLASDGGLFVPQTWPHLTGPQIAGFAGRAYADVAAAVVGEFIGDEIGERDLRRMCDAAYSDFGHTAVAPLVQLDPGRWALELFHGPTLAFKDVAMQLLARLMDHVLADRGGRVTILGATSGDTGSAAIHAFRDRDNIDVFILFPDGRVSPIQRLQMTTTAAANVHPIAIKGTFDDCQAIVKSLFGNAEFRDRVRPAAVNSINWARVLGQIVYYFTAAVALGAPARRVSFAVPTGNFGDIFAGYAAKRIGLPIDRLVIATNVNDILVRMVADGEYRVSSVTATISPSMDIQVSSNFERLLYELHDRDGDAVTEMMADLKRHGHFALSGQALAGLRADFDAGRCDEAETASEIRATHEETGFLADPHTAVGLRVARRFAALGTPMVSLATAHPAKFAAAVKGAAGVEPHVPPRIAALMTRAERCATLANDVHAVGAYVLAKTAAVRENA